MDFWGAALGISICLISLRGLHIFQVTMLTLECVFLQDTKLEEIHLCMLGLLWYLINLLYLITISSNIYLVTNAKDFSKSLQIG